MKYDLAIIGAGPAGLAAGLAAWEMGVERIVIIERGEEAGGILRQCVHTGFGLRIFKEELSGPEYAKRYTDEIEKTGIEFMFNTMVIDFSKDKKLVCVNRERGVFIIEAKAVVLAMGCRERPRGPLRIPGSRPAGIYTAGTAQKLVNLDGYMPGKNIVILGSGDIGLIMARRMTLEGARVKMVLEIMDHPGGLTRNIVQCLNDFNIPLKLKHTVVSIHGKERLKGVTIAMVDDGGRPDMETAEYVSCDTLLLSVGLIPENELTEQAEIEMDPKTGGPVVDNHMETSLAGVFACGNVVHVNDLADNVTEESILAGKSCAGYILEGEDQNREYYRTIPGENIRYVVPQRIRKGSGGKTEMMFRSAKIINNGYIEAKTGDKQIYIKRKDHIVPGEIETIGVGNGISGDITVNVFAPGEAL